MDDKKILALMAAVVAIPVAMFFKGAWDDAKKQAEEAANPRTRWTDKNRWE